MEEDDIYICFPGELVVYQPHALDDQNAGLLCTVKGIKNGKVELTVCPNSNANILAQPCDLIECGDYGSDLFDVKDEVSSLYDGYDESSCMDLEDMPHEETITTLKTPNMEIETALYYYFSKSYVQAYDCLNLVPESASGDNTLYLAKCMEQLGDMERALHYFTSSYHASGGISAYKACCISMCFQKIGNAVEAWSWCQRALQSNPQSPLPRYVAARLLYLEVDTHRTECLDQIHSCVLHCPVLDIEQFPSEALEMWIDIARMTENLQCDSKVQIRAWLRAIGVCRSAGVLTPRDDSSPGPINRRTAEAAAMRIGACTALYELGRLLETLAIALVTSRPSTAAARPAQSLSSSRTGSSGGSKPRKGLKLDGPANARAAASASPAIPAGWGYVRGAYAAYFLCNEVGKGANREHRKALTSIISVLSTMSK